LRHKSSLNGYIKFSKNGHNNGIPGPGLKKLLEEFETQHFTNRPTPNDWATDSQLTIVVTPPSNFISWVGV